MPTILTCVVGKRLGESPQEDHWALRSTATDILLLICNKYGASYHTLQPRVTRTLLRAFLDPEKPLTTHYGAILGLTRMGNEVFKTLVVPNLKTYSTIIESELLVDGQDREGSFMEIEGDIASTIRKNEASHCLEALLVNDTILCIAMSLIYRLQAPNHLLTYYLIPPLYYVDWFAVIDQERDREAKVCGQGCAHSRRPSRASHGCHRPTAGQEPLARGSHSGEPRRRRRCD